MFNCIVILFVTSDVLILDVNIGETISQKKRFAVIIFEL